MNDIQTFLAELALNPKKFADFLRDPDEAIGRAGLSAEDRAALISGIPAMIYARLIQYLAYPPPYYTPASDWFAFPRPNFVTMPPFPPLPPGSPPRAEMVKGPINFVTIAPLYATAAPPLYIPASLPPNFVTSPPQPPHRPEPAREAPEPAAPVSPKTPPKKRKS